MDLAFFGLKQRPFPTTPDTAWYYPASGHEQALVSLLDALGNDEGIALLTGEPGTGKTLLCHCLFDRLEAAYCTAFVVNSHFADRASLLQAILYELSVSVENRNEQELRLALNDFLLAQFGTGKRSLLVVDECQHLSPDLLEELRLLTNLDAPAAKVFQVILVGQTSLLETLRRPELGCLAQRLVTRAQLDALSLHEAADYLNHHARCAGARPGQLFTDEACEILARGTRGTPRLLNQAARRALIVARSAELRRVDAEVAVEALAALGLDEGASDDASISEMMPPGEQGSLRTASLGDEAESEGAARSATRIFPTTRRPA